MSENGDMKESKKKEIMEMLEGAVKEAVKIGIPAEELKAAIDSGYMEETIRKGERDL